MKKVTLGFGRMNPSTTGHELVAKSIAKAAKSRGAVARLYLSHTTNPKKDPLSYDDKIKFAKLAFSKMIDVVKSRARTIIEVMIELEKEKFTDVTLVVGSDRVAEFERLLNRYNGKDFTFNSIEVISAGERDPDAEGVSGMSASKMRGFVRDNDFNKFKEGVPSAINDAQAKQMFDAVKKGMRLTESIDEACWVGYKQQGLKKKGNRMVPNCVPEEKTNEALSMAQRRKRGMVLRRMKAKLKRTRELAMRRFASQSKLKTRARRAALKFLKRRFGAGKAYKSLSVGQKIAVDKKVEKMKGAVAKISMRLLPRVRKAEIERKKRQNQASKNEQFKNFFEGKVAQDKDIAGKSGTQPAKYFKGLDKDTKERRDAHFKRMGPKADDDKSAYADAPGDKEAREKGMPQSKHTKKFKQMFGEEMDKKQVNKLEQLVRMGLADKKLLAIIKRSISKMDAGEVLNPQERSATQNLLSTLLDMVTSSDQLFRLTRTQLQKEEFDVKESIYKGNIGAMEVFEFYQKASLTQIAELKKLIGQQKFKEAWALVTKVTGKKLDEMFEDTFETNEEDDEYDYDETDGIQMAQIEVANLMQDAEVLLEILDELDEEPEAWVLSKITKAADYIESVTDYLEFEGMYNYDDDEEEDEDEYEVDDEEIYEAIISIPKEELNEEELQEFSDLFEEIEGLKKKAEKSGIAYSILKQVYNRGMAAWQGGHRPGTTAQQWAFARVNSFITKGKGTWGGADSDLAKKVTKNEEFANFIEALEYGTDQARIAYARATPGQSIEITRYSANDAIDAINNANMQRMFKLFSEGKLHEAIDWHVDNNVPLFENVYRVGSEKYFEVFREARKLYNEGKLELCSEDKALITETDIGEFAKYEGRNVPLDCPMYEEEDKEKDPPLNQPKRGGPKKFYVFVRKPDGGIKKVTWGDTTGLSVKMNDPEARKSFAARHQCSMQKDRTSAAYWACNTPRYAKQLGLSGGGNFFW